MALRILTFLAFIFGGLSAGYAFRRLGRFLPGRNLDLAPLRRGIQRIVLLFGVPTVILGSLWILDLERGGLGILPLLGVVHTVSGGASALVIGNLLNLDRRGKGAFFCNGFFTNLGSFGGLAVFLLLGEASYALVLLYKMFLEVMFYGIGFPVAKSFSTGADRLSFSISGVLGRVFSDLFVVVALSAMAAGIMLNIAGIPRPAFYTALNGILIPGNALLMLFAIGLGLRFSRMKGHLREAFATMGLKFVLSPLIVIPFAFLLGMRLPEDLPVLRVVLILSVMPPAFTATVPPSLYDLDLDLANSCWFISTVAVIIVMPVLALLLQYMG